MRKLRDVEPRRHKYPRTSSIQADHWVVVAVTPPGDPAPLEELRSSLVIVAQARRLQRELPIRDPCGHVPICDAVNVDVADAREQRAECCLVVLDGVLRQVL